VSIVTLVAIVVAGMGSLAGFWLGVHLARRSDHRGQTQVHRNALQFMREGDAMRSAVLEWVTRAQKDPPTVDDYRALVDAVLHSSTPEAIRQMHHRLCGIAPEEGRS